MNHPDFIEAVQNADTMEISGCMTSNITLEITDVNEELDPYLTVESIECGRPLTWQFDSEALEATYFDVDLRCWLTPDNIHIRLFETKEMIPLMIP